MKLVSVPAPLIQVSIGVVDDVPPCLRQTHIERCEILAIFCPDWRNRLVARLCGHHAEEATRQSDHQWFWNPDGTCGCRARECYNWAAAYVEQICPFESIPDNEAFCRAMAARYWWAAMSHSLTVPLSEAQAWVDQRQ